MNYLNFAYRTLKRGLTEFVMILIDLSNSMNNDDWQPSRKAGASKANIELIKVKTQHFPNDIVGIIGFGTNAQVLHPPIRLCEGADSLCRVLNRLPDMNWTNFTAALELAETCLFGKPVTKTTPPNRGLCGFLSWLLYDQQGLDSNYIKEISKEGNYIRRIILLSDGDYNEGGSPIKVARILKNKGVVIDCIGIGGSPDEVEVEKIKEVASRNSDGSLRYCFIGDQQSLIRKYESLAHHIRLV
jgi:hypothetical protein